MINNSYDTHLSYTKIHLPSREICLNNEFLAVWVRFGFTRLVARFAALESFVGNFSLLKAEFTEEPSGTKMQRNIIWWRYSIAQRDSSLPHPVPADDRRKLRAFRWCLALGHFSIAWLIFGGIRGRLLPLFARLFYQISPVRYTVAPKAWLIPSHLFSHLFRVDRSNKARSLLGPCPITSKHKLGPRTNTLCGKFQCHIHNLLHVANLIFMLLINFVYHCWNQIKDTSDSQ